MPKHVFVGGRPTLLIDTTVHSASLRQPESPDATTTLIRIGEVMRRTGLPRSSLYAKIASGDFCAPVKQGASPKVRAVGFDSRAVDSWINTQLSRAHTNKETR